MASLQNLNPYVQVTVFEGNELNPEKVKDFSVVVITELILPLSKLQALNEATRQTAPDKQGVGFILALCTGLSGSVFVDFGNYHVINDENGIPTNTRFIQSISKGFPAVVTVESGTVIECKISF